MNTIKKPVLETYDYNEFRKLKKYYKNQFAEDYKSASNRPAKINLHSNFIAISESLQDTKKSYHAECRQELSNSVDSVAYHLLSDDNFLNEVYNIFDEVTYGIQPVPSIKEDTEPKKIFNEILEAHGRVFKAFCSPGYFNDRLKSLKMIIKENKKVFINSYDFYFPEIEDDYSFFFYLEKLYRENFKITARLHPLQALTDIINLNGYEYEIKEQDFIERASIRENKIHPNSMNTFFQERKEAKKQYKLTRQMVLNKACDVIEDSGNDLSYFLTDSGDANTELWDTVFKSNEEFKKGSVRDWLREALLETNKLREMLKERKKK